MSRRQPSSIDPSARFQSLNLSDDEHTYDTPGQPRTRSHRSKQSQSQSHQAPLPETPRTQTSAEEQEARDAALRAELEGLRRMNQVIEGVNASLDRASTNMAVSLLSSSRARDLTVDLPPASPSVSAKTPLIIHSIDYQQHNPLRLFPPSNLHAHPLADRTHLSPSAASILARRLRRCRRCRRRSRSARTTCSTA